MSEFDRIYAAWLRAGPDAVVAGMSAAILHGVQYFDRDADVELIRPATGQGRRRNEVRIIRTCLEPADVQTIRGIPVTTPIRTAYDIGRRPPEWRALGRLDDLVRTTGIDLVELWAYIRDRPRRRGIWQIRELIKHIDPASESPGESWLRHVMITRGLPRPQTQIVVQGVTGVVIARLDFGYRRYKLGIEFDGVDFHTAEHQRAADGTRDEQLGQVGWRVVRVVGARLAAEPGAVIEGIAEALRQRGWEPDH